MLEDVNTNHLVKVPDADDLYKYKNAEFWFNTPKATSVLSEYQLANIQEVRMHNYCADNEYNLNGEIIREEEIIGSDGGFYIGFFSEIAYLQLRTVYRCNDFTIIRYRSADKDAEYNEWNSDIKFIVFHTAQEKQIAQRNFVFQQLIEKLNDFDWNMRMTGRFNDYFDELDDLEIIEEIIED